MPDGGGFDVDSLFQSATQGKLTAPGSQPGGVSVPVGPSAPPGQSAAQPDFDPEDLFKQAVKGQLKAPPQAAPAESSGFMSNVAAGANKAIGAPVDAVTWGLNKGIQGINSVAGSHIPQIEHPVGGSEWIGKLAGTDNVQPTGLGDQIAQGIGGAVANVPMMGLGGAAVGGKIGSALAEGSGAGSAGQAIRATTQAAAGGAAQPVAEDVAPDNLKPLAGMAGAALGGGLVAGAESGARAIGGGIRNAAGEAGIGSNAAPIAAGHRVSEALGEQGRQNLDEALRANPNGEIVPGSAPTTGELAQTPGAHDLETTARLTNGPQFVQRAADRNNARVTAIQNAEPTNANPSTLGQVVAQKLGQLDSQVQSQPLLQAGGPETNANIRSALQSAKEPWAQAARQAWAQVDPDGTWAIQSSPLRSSANDLLGQVSPTGANDAQVMGLLQRGAVLPDAIPFSALSQMRQDANEAIARLSSTQGNRSQIYRVGQFKQAIDQTIGQAIDQKAQVDPDLSSRLEGMFGNSDRPGQTPPAPAPTGPQPNVTPENIAQYQQANAATAAAKQFNIGGVGKILQPGNNFQDFKLPEGRVASQIFTGNGTEPAEVSNFIQRMGGVQNAEPLARDALVNDLRGKNIIDKSTGNVNPGKLADWQAARAATLDQFPNLKQELSSVQGMSQNLKDYQDSVAGKIIGADPRNTVNTILSGANPSENMKQLVASVQSNPDALASLRRIFVDHIMERFTSGKPSTDGFDFMKNGAMQQWINQNKGPLRELFQGGQGLQWLNQVGADIRRQSLPPTAVAGSQTAPNMLRTAAAGLGGGGGHHGTWLALLGEHLGEKLGDFGMVGAVGLPLAGRMVENMKAAGIRNRNDLNAWAMLHPQYAKVLMEKADANALARESVQRRIGNAFAAGTAADFAAGQEQRQ